GIQASLFLNDQHNLPKTSTQAAFSHRAKTPARTTLSTRTTLTTTATRPLCAHRTDTDHQHSHQQGTNNPFFSVHDLLPLCTVINRYQCHLWLSSVEIVIEV